MKILLIWNLVIPKQRITAMSGTCSIMLLLIVLIRENRLRPMLRVVMKFTMKSTILRVVPIFPNFSWKKNLLALYFEA
jgi:hypothetical protein